MPETKKEPRICELCGRTCHICGLEDLTMCEDSAVHQSSMPDELPCRECRRNPEKKGGKFDFWNEDWASTISMGKSTAELEDSDDKKRELVEKLAELRGGEKLGE